MPLYQWTIASGLADNPFSDDALVQAMLRFESGLAAAQAKVGLIPDEAAAAIATHCATLTLDAAELAQEAREKGSLAVPVVSALTAHVAAHDEAAARYVHFGATSQDMLDTATALCAKVAVGRLDALLQRTIRAARSHAQHHAATPALARTLLQPATVASIGLKCAQWTLALSRVRRRLLRAGVDGLAVSLGGAVGNLAAYGDAGAMLRAELAGLLGLHDSGATWHTRREDWIALACEAALISGTFAKIARDIAILCQAEVGEASEPVAAGRGGSTAMPHKRNPVLTMRVLAATHAVPNIMASLLAAMPQEHERGLGNWQAELAQYPEVLLRSVAGAEALADLLEGLQFDPTRCRANIDALHGTVFSERLAALLIPKLGRSEAQALVTSMCREAVETRTHLRQLAREYVAGDARLKDVGAIELTAVFEVDAAAKPSATEAMRMLESLNRPKG
jgi:3-carboxy-cis,cis-muconate cycloisomerase